MLRDILPDRYRKAAYGIFALIGVLLGSVPVYCGATATDTPTVVLGALAVYSFLGGAFGLTAASNIAPVPTAKRGLYREQD